MNNNRRLKLFLSVIYLTVIAAALPAFDLWQHPESAQRNSLFVAASAPQFSINDGFEFQLTPQFNFDYMLPFRFPLSLGAFLKTPSPNLKNFGTRIAYHINLDEPKTNFYFLYVFDFGFIRNDLLEQYGDERQPLRFFDFRIGLRRRINHFLFIQIESDFQFQSVVLGLSAKLF